MVSSTPPGAWGGNIDLKFCGVGSSLFLPVFNKGAQFFTGDGHAVQGDGEVDGGAIEISLRPTLQFVLHKRQHLKLPRVETGTEYVTTGLDVDLNVAARIALQEAIEFLESEKGLTRADAYALASLAVDLGIGEAVDVVNLVYARIPKTIFRENPEFWHRPD
jgi:acetamidase/formamidase